MRVLFFTTSGNYNGGGVMCLMETLGKIDRNIIQPYVLIPTHGSTENVLNSMGIPYSIIRCYDWLLPRTYLHSFDYVIKRPIRCLINRIAEIRIKRLLIKQHIEAYHLNSIYNDCGVAAAKGLNIPVMWHLREFVTDDAWSPEFVDEKKAYQKIETAEVLISVSDCIKKYYQKKMPNANITTVYDGVDCSSLIPYCHNKEFRNPIHLGMVGGVAPVKGHEDAIRAVGELNKRGIHCQLEIIGRYRDGQYKESLDKIIEEYNIQHLVHFFGNCKNMGEKWKDIDVLLVCSRSESFGRVIIEAMYQGIAVIAANNTGSRELLDDGKYGALYATYDYKDLTDKIIELMTYKQITVKEIKGHERSMQFSIYNSACRLIEVYALLRRGAIE